MQIEKLYPECKNNLWGGTKLIERYHKVTGVTPCAESWELSFHPDGPTKLSDGRLLSEAIDKKDPLVLALKEWIDKEYEDGRQTTLSTGELEEKIEELSGKRFSRL